MDVRDVLGVDVRDVLGVDVRDALGVNVSDGVTGWELEDGRRALVLGELADEGEVRLSCMLWDEGGWVQMAGVTIVGGWVLWDGVADVR